MPSDSEKQIRVELGARSYAIHVGAGLLDRVGDLVVSRFRPSRLAVIADDTVATLYGEQLLASARRAGFSADLVAFPAGEASKSLACASNLWDRLFALGLDRKSQVLALGGGVTGDLAGFVAATFMRGIPFVQVPTSLLAQVDSSSGGKTGINHPSGKNLIGVFHQPSLVVIDVETLRTLPLEELRCGLAEVVKHGVIRDAGYFERVEASAEALLAVDRDAMIEIVAGSCRIKAAFVAADEREGGERAILNFGHTFGHAFESLSAYAIRHGEAVAMGMATACRLAEAVRGLDPSVRARVEGLLRKLGLPTAPPAFPPEKILAAMRGDKKTERGRLRLVLPTRIGEAAVVSEIPDEAILDALRASSTAGSVG